MTSLVLSDSRIAQSSLCSARTVWLPSAETWSKAVSPWQLEKNGSAPREIQPFFSSAPFTR